MVKINYVRANVGHDDQTTAVEYHHLTDMIPDGGSMKSFAGFIYIVMVRWLSACSWRSSQRFYGSLIGIREVALDHGYAHLLHDRAIKQRLIVYAGVWHARGIVIVVPWYMIKR